MGRVNNHRLMGSVNNRNTLCQFEVRSRRQQVASAEASLPGMQTATSSPCLHSAIFRCVSVSRCCQIFSSYKNTSQIVLGLTWPHVTVTTSLFFFLDFVFCWFVFSFWPCGPACRTLVPWPGIEPSSPALKVQSLNHWTTREVPLITSLKTLSPKTVTPGGAGG